MAVQFELEDLNMRLRPGAAPHRDDPRRCGVRDVRATSGDALGFSVSVVPVNFPVLRAVRALGCAFYVSYEFSFWRGRFTIFVNTQSCSARQQLNQEPGQAVPSGGSPTGQLSRGAWVSPCHGAPLACAKAAQENTVPAVSAPWRTSKDRPGGAALLPEELLHPDRMVLAGVGVEHTQLVECAPGSTSWGPRHPPPGALGQPCTWTDQWLSTPGKYHKVTP